MRLEMQLSRKALLDQSNTNIDADDQMEVKKNEQENRRERRSLGEDLARLAAEEEAPLSGHQRRHPKADVKHLNKMVKTLMAEQHDLQKQMVRLSSMRLTTESNVHKMERELESVVRRTKSSASCSEDVQLLKAQSKRLTSSVEKLSVKVGGVDQVQSSTLQLFEAMERLEERYDADIDVLQREVSKLEFNDAQLTSSVHTLHEDQSNVNDLVKGVKATVTILQERVHADQIRAALLTAKLANNTLHLTNHSLQTDANRWRMARMEQSLHTLQSQQTPQSLTIDDVRRNYDHLVHDLPHGNSH